MKKGYANGSDMLLKIGGKCVGHCSNHSVSITSETKDRAVKPVKSQGISAGLWKEKGVTGLSVSVSAEGLVFYQETENGYKSAVAMIVAGQSVEVEAFERENDETPYMKGKFVVASLERTDPAQDDATYSIQLENDGMVEFDEKGLTETPAAE